MTRLALGALKPADSQSVGAPSADPRSDVGFRASGGVGSQAAQPVFDLGSVEGAGGEPQARGRCPQRGGSGAAPPGGTPIGVPSSLDTTDTTRAGREKAAPATEQWTRKIGEATERHRRDRAKDHHRKARSAVRRARQSGYSDVYAQQEGKWHRDRARGQEERVARVLDCGADVLEVLCQGCGKKHERLKGCRVGLLCVRCRGSIAAEKRRKFLSARAVVLADAEARGLLRANRRGGRWSEKLVTLTVPHRPEDTIAGRVHLLREAWDEFLRRLNKHLRNQGAHRSAQFFRCIEWTPASDGLGHPHIHLWFFGPYLERDHLETCWRAALEFGGCVVGQAPIVFDVRAVKDGIGGAQEVIKYLTKDIDAAGNKIDPVVYAEVYKAFDGRRLTQASSGFMKRGDRREACECGSLLPKSVTIRTKETGE